MRSDLEKMPLDARLGLLSMVLFHGVSCAKATPVLSSELHPEARPAALLAAHASSDASPADASPEADAAEARIDPDGNDDPYDPGSGPVPGSGRFVRVGLPPLGLQRICDMRPHEGRLVMAHANQPLGTDGATLTAFRPDDPRRPFAVVFDWNRPGEPSKGGGAGQGFLRVHAIDGRLFVPDADPPYAGLGAVDGATEGYVFISDSRGAFAPSRPPNHGLPVAPTEDRAGVGILPRAYHVIDVIKVRGHLYASTGSVPPKARAWSGPSPGALHVASPDLKRWTFDLSFPVPYPGGVWRLTYMVRFRDRLYAGIQDYEGTSPFDYVVLKPGPEARALSQGDLSPVRVTTDGAAFTLRWYADRGVLYWIAGSRGGEVKLRSTRDGDFWDVIELPEGVGRPTDIKRFRDGLVVLTERALLSLEGTHARIVAGSPEKKTPFVLNDIFCSAPLAVLGGQLYAGGQRGGALYRLDTDADAGSP